jgi:hypothetical protein
MKLLKLNSLAIGLFCLLTTVATLERGLYGCLPIPSMSPATTWW